MEVKEFISDKGYFEVLDELKVSEDNLKAGLINQPTLYATFSFQYAKAKEQVEDLNLLLESESSRFKISQKRNKETGFKCTDKLLDSLAASDENLIAIQKKLIIANKQLTLLKSLISALEHRKDILIQLSANHRAETNLIIG